MSFVQFNPAPLLTKTQIAAQVLQVAQDRGLDPFAAVIALMAIDTEVGADDSSGTRQWWCPANPGAEPSSSNYPHDSESDDGRSVGYFQQQTPWWGTVEDEMTLAKACDTFLTRLSDDYLQAKGNPSLAGQFVQSVQGSAFPARYQESWDLANQVLSETNSANPTQDPTGGEIVSPSPSESQETYTVVAGDTLYSIGQQFAVSVSDLEQANPTVNPRNMPVGTVLNLPNQTSQPAVTPTPTPVAPGVKPAYTEKEMWCTNLQPRMGTTVDLWLLHTEEANDTAEGLANFLISTENGSNPVSYHYTIRQNPDGSVTVVDVVDTDYASWSVENSNDRSINLCFAGSAVAWTTEQWMLQSNAIDVAAYLCVQDCIKYGIKPNMLVDLDANGNPQYIADPPGIADHRYCGEYLHDGNNHTDVGDNFPWPYFASRVAAYVAATSPTPAPPVPAPTPEPTPAPQPAPAPDPTPAPSPAPVFQHPDQATMIQEVWDQLRGPEGAGWPQLGGLSLVDAVAKLLGG